MKRARLFLADDHAMLLDAFQRLLADDYDIVGTAGDGQELIDRAPELRPDVVVADLKMPNLNGIDAAVTLKKVLPKTKVVFLTSSDDPQLAARAMANGASGFVLKSCAAKELLAAIDVALQGQTYVTPVMAGRILDATRQGEDAPQLTPRQREVLQLLVRGRTMKQVATVLGISPATVAHHKYAMMESLGIESSAELIEYAVRAGLSD